MDIQFGDYELQLATRRLVADGEPVHVEPQVFSVLAHLATNRDRVVTKIELLDEVWGSRFVSESAITSRIKAARAAIGDSGREQHSIRTVHGSGYQFVAAAVEGGPDGDGTIARTDGSATAATDAVRRVPPTTNEFRGRVDELSELRDQLADERVVTLIGPGGTGKTRLSIELARRLPDDESVVFINLAAVRDEQALGQALAAALGIDAGSSDDPIDAACAYVRTRPILLIVDNCEHVSEAAAVMVRRVLDQTTTATVLATSRVPLGLRDEFLFRLHPLPVLRPDNPLAPSIAASNAAVELFVDRVRRVDRSFQLDEDSLPGVLSLCAALDGLPLALELAAGRMGAFGLDDLVARLDRRLDLLDDNRNDAEDRHRSLRATLDWSYDLLDDECQRLFRTLAVFPSGLTIDAIEWLGSRLDGSDERTVLDALERLVSASLVARVERPSGTRYLQLETMRTFGLDQLERLDESDAARDLAARWVLALLAELDDTMRGPREMHWDDRIRREVPNIRESRLHLRRNDRCGELVQISVHLDEWARLRDVSEMWTWCDELLEIDEIGDRDRARALALAAQAAWRRGRVPDAERLGRSAIAEAGDDTWALAHGYSALGVAKLFMGDFLEAADAWETRAAIDGYEIDRANAALCHAYAGDLDTARSMLADALGRTDDEWPTARAWSEYVTGEIESVAGSAGAVRWLEAAVDHATEVGSSFTVGVAGLTLCTTAAREGLDGVAARYADLIEHWLRSGTWTQLWTTLRHAATMVSAHDPLLALEIIAVSDRDPHAAGLDSEAAARLEEFRSELVERVGADQAAVLADAVVYTDRSELAERTRSRLAALG